MSDRDGRKSAVFAPWILRGPLVAALDLGVLCAVDRVPSASLVVAFLGLVLAFEHFDPTIWRAPSLLFAGVGWTGLAYASVSAGLDGRWMGPLAGALAGAATGHILYAGALTFRNRSPISVAPGRLRRAAETALSARGSPYRIDPAGTTVPAPQGARGDRSVRVETPRGQLPLYPQGPCQGMGRAVKRVSDLTLVVASLPVVSLVVLGLAAAVRCSSAGPAFHSQVRLTLRERRFRIFKLRSMIVDAEPRGIPVWPLDDDPRITPLGRRLRVLWLDELPQLLNVLAGQMSLVGPRPERPTFAQEFAAAHPNYRWRHQVVAGMTGLAQVTGLIGNTSLRRRLILDLRYVRMWSPWLDAKILGATLARSIRRAFRRKSQP